MYVGVFVLDFLQAICEDGTVYGPPRKHTMFLQHTTRMKNSISYITKHRNVFILFATGTLVALLYFLLAFFFGTHGPSYPVIDGEEDSAEYIYLAEHLLEGRGFTLSHAPPHIPESFRVPGYPFFVALILGVYPSPVLVVIVQCFLFGGIAGLVFLIGSQWHSTRAGYVAAAFSIVNPSLLFHTSIIASETLFIFLLLLATYLWFDLHFGNRQKRVAFFVGTLIGVAILIRVIGILLPLAFILISCIASYSVLRAGVQAWKRLLAIWFLFLCGTALIATPWLVRNIVVYNEASFSQTGTINMWYFYIPQIISDSRNIDVAQARAEFIPEHLLRGMERTNGLQFPLRQLDAHATLQHEIHAYFAEHLPEYLWGHLLRSSTLIFVDSFRDTAILFGVSTGNYNILPREVVATLRSGKYISLPQTMWSYVRERNASALLSLTNFALWVTFLLSSMLGAFALWRSIPRYKATTIVLYCLGIACYFAVLSGPLALPRFRLPIEPFVFILSAPFFLVAFDIIRARVSHKEPAILAERE